MELSMQRLNDSRTLQSTCRRGWCRWTMSTGTKLELCTRIFFALHVVQTLVCFRLLAATCSTAAGGESKILQWLLTIVWLEIQKSASNRHLQLQLPVINGPPHQMCVPQRCSDGSVLQRADLHTKNSKSSCLNHHCDYHH